MNPSATDLRNEPNGSPRPRILLVDDHEAGRKALSRLLGALGFEVAEAGDGDTALGMLAAPGRFDFVLTDVRLPDIDGREIVQVARRLMPPPRIALMTGWDVDDDEKERLGIEWIFLKPLDIADIVAKLQAPPILSAPRLPG